MKQANKLPQKEEFVSRSPSRSSPERKHHPMPKLISHHRSRSSPSNSNPSPTPPSSAPPPAAAPPTRPRFAFTAASEDANAVPPPPVEEEAIDKKLDELEKGGLTSSQFQPPRLGHGVQHQFGESLEVPKLGAVGADGAQVELRNRTSRSTIASVGGQSAAS